MLYKSKNTNRNKFFIKNILPAILAITLFIISIFVIIIPAFENNIMDRKREMIRELTNSAWSILLKYENEEINNIFTKESAQQKAISEIRHLRYGEEMKDYFWITDMQPKMIVHPYRTELEGKLLMEFKDPLGKKLFVEFVNIVKINNEGYINYMWQWKDDSSRIVPKLSFVKLFKPWGWIIGTGIYIEDVKTEIKQMESRLIKISVLITVIIAFLLLLIIRQSNRIEKNRLEAELELKHSREKYRALVEASTEGSMMILEDDIYANKLMLDLLDYNETEIKNLNVFDIIYDEKFKNQISGFKDFTESIDTPRQFETKLRRKNGDIIDVMINISKISLIQKDAIIIIIKNLVNDDLIENKSVVERKRLMDITDSFQIGIFRSILARRSIFIEANYTAVEIFGFDNKYELFKTNIEDLFADADERKHFVRELIKNGIIKKRIIKIVKNNKTSAFVRVSLTVVNETENNIKYCDGIVEDITEIKYSEISKNQIIEDIQHSQYLLNQPILDFIKPPIFCETNTTIKKAVSIMNAQKSNTIMIKTNEGYFIGIVTDEDIRKRVVAEQLNFDEPVYKIMSAPLISVSENALIYEALCKMRDNKINYLMVNDNSGEIKNIVRIIDIMNLYENLSSLLIQKIKNSKTIEYLKIIHESLKQTVDIFISGGANPNQITRIISSVSETITEKIINLAIEELGIPPVSFAFITLGSVGREEQTLATDQDNAIVYEDVPSEKEVNSYFLHLGERVCSWLNYIGYSYCKGDIMAKNPKFCKPVSVWKQYFSEWLTTKEPQDLLDFNIFFDLRYTYGNRSLIKNLKEHLNIVLEHNNLFFYHLALNTLSIKPHVGFFGNIIKDSKDGNHNCFDIKKMIMTIVGFARIYALKYKIDENNTIIRIRKLYKQNIILKSEFDIILQMYDFLMNMRFKHQVAQLKENKEADNYINTDKLTELDNLILKKILSQLNNLNTRLSIDFKGTLS